MSSYGLLDSGFVDKPLENIIEDLEEDQKAEIATDLDVSSTSPVGQLNGIIGAHLRELWEVAQALWSAMDPDKNEGLSQTAIASWTGSVREAATKSLVTGRLNLNAGAVVPAGSVASVAGSPTSRFLTLVEAENTGGIPADFDVTMEAETAGPVVANANTLTNIDTPVSGWNSITNPADATIGSPAETDGELRERREEEIRAAGGGAVEALLADILSLKGVTSCAVFENTTAATDADGLPPHSFEVVVQGGADQDIADQIWLSKPTGIGPFGSSSAVVKDSQGNDHTMYFSRPVAVPIYIDITVFINEDPDLGPVYPVDGDTQVKSAISAWGQANLTVGADYYYRRLYAVVVGENDSEGIDGVVDVTVLESDISASPATEQNLVISARSIGTISTTDITVTTT
jgi:uncharacterized phage protein gp47/JayE